MASSERKSYAVYRGSEGVIKKSLTPVPDLGPKEVLVKITHTGLCASDSAYIGSGVALGHEGVGIVEAIGTDVTQFKIGDRAGGGYHRNSCGHCSYCLKGEDIYCYERTIFGEGDYSNGTISDYYIGHETYLHRIPEALTSEDAAPLQCAGATVYSALIETIKPTDRVGVIGIGGLGHLAIQFASKLGAYVVAFSSNHDKEQEAGLFGAKEFVAFDKPEQLEKPINVLVVAGSKYPDWEKFLVKSVLARNGTIVPLAAPMHGPLSLPAWPMFFDAYHVHSNLVSSRGRHDEMLEFAALHGIKPTLEKFELSEEGVAAALEKLKAGKMRYRGVLVAKH